jgi:hypothetical protein
MHDPQPKALGGDFGGVKTAPVILDAQLYGFKLLVRVVCTSQENLHLLCAGVFDHVV